LKTREFCKISYEKSVVFEAIRSIFPLNSREFDVRWPCVELAQGHPPVHLAGVRLDDRPDLRGLVAVVERQEEVTPPLHALDPLFLEAARPGDQRGQEFVGRPRADPVAHPVLVVRPVLVISALGPEVGLVEAHRAFPARREVLAGSGTAAGNPWFLDPAMCPALSFERDADAWN
jgi:hypothetical protein